MGCLEQITEEDLLQEECYGGLDLASEGDIAAYVLYFPKSKRFIEYYFCPEAKIEDRKQGDGVDYRQWAHDGFIIPTIGDWIDYRFIQHTILESMKKFVVKEINYDAWGAAKMVQELIEEGAPFFPFRQGYKSMSPPAKELNNLFHKGEIKHNGNPVTRWMMGNVFITYDPTLAIKIDKSKSTEKVDGIVALVMALGGWIENRDDDYYNGIGVGIL
jgi:phage terminase large subunit-like protein